MKEVCQRLEPEVVQAGMEMRVDAPDSLPIIRADPGRLEQVVTNLVHNAVKYASDGKRIALRAGATERSFVLDVQDYGAGISL